MVEDESEAPAAPGGSYTLNEALEKIGMGWFQYILLLLCGGTVATDACQTFMMACLIPAIDDIWDLESPWGSMIPITYVAGMMCSGLIWSKIADMYGRKFTLMIAVTTMATFTTATIFADNIYWLLMCRFFTGLGYIQPTVLILALEFSPVKSRAKNVAFTFCCWTAGGMLSIILAWLILPVLGEEIGWKYYVLATSVPIWIMAILTFWTPESAHWLCTVGNFHKAEKMIQWVAKINGKEPLQGRLVRENKIIKERGRIKDAFVPRYRRATFILIFGYTTFCFVYYGVIFLSERLFETKSLYISLSLINLSELPAIIFGMYMPMIGWNWMTIYTRMIPALGVAIAAILWPYVDSVSYIWVINVVLVFAARGLSLTASMVILTHFSVYYPTAIRATAIGFALSISRLGAMGAIFISEDLEIETSLTILPIVSSVACVVSLFLKDISVKKELTNDVDRSISATAAVEIPIKRIKEQYIP